MPRVSPSGLSECHRERQSDQLFLCYGTEKGSLCQSRDVQAYKENNLTLPAGIKCHSSISTSWAALKVVPLLDICAVANWSSTDTFSRYYTVNVAAPGAMEVAVVLGPSTSA